MIDDLGKIFFNKLQELKDQGGGKIDINNIDSIVEQFISLIKIHVSSESEINLFSEIQSISKQISSMKKDLTLIDNKKVTTDFPNSADLLKSVTESTEKSTNLILTKAEEISLLATKIDNAEIRDQMQQYSLSIMEACNFQDLTGQIINKVIKTLNEVESIVSKLVMTFKDEKVIAEKEKKDDSHLMNGPQAPDKAPSQKQIDDLFDSV